MCETFFFLSFLSFLTREYSTVAHGGRLLCPSREGRHQVRRVGWAVWARVEDQDHGQRHAGSDVLGAMEGYRGEDQQVKRGPKERARRDSNRVRLLATVKAGKGSRRRWDVGEIILLS